LGRRNYEINKNLVRRDYEIKKKKSAEQIKFNVKRLRPVFRYRVASLVRDVDDYKVQRSEQGASPATVNRELACLRLRRAFNLAIEEELIEKLPRFKLLPEPDPREEYREPDEFIAFQRTARAIDWRKNFDGQIAADLTLFREVR
jgi:hypothetical protein